MRLKDFAKVANTNNKIITISIYDKNDKSLFTFYNLDNYTVAFYMTRYPELAKQKIVYLQIGFYLSSDIVLNIVVNHRLYSYIVNFEQNEDIKKSIKCKIKQKIKTRR